MTLESIHKKTMTKETSHLLYMLERPLGKVAVLPCVSSLPGERYLHLEGKKKCRYF